MLQVCIVNMYCTNMHLIFYTSATFLLKPNLGCHFQSPTWFERFLRHAVSNDCLGYYANSSVRLLVCLSSLVVSCLLEGNTLVSFRRVFVGRTCSAIFTWTRFVPIGDFWFRFNTAIMIQGSLEMNFDYALIVGVPMLLFGSLS